MGFWVFSEGGRYCTDLYSSRNASASMIQIFGWPEGAMYMRIYPVYCVEGGQLPRAHQWADTMLPHRGVHSRVTGTSEGIDGTVTRVTGGHHIQGEPSAGDTAIVRGRIQTPDPLNVATPSFLDGSTTYRAFQASAGVALEEKLMIIHTLLSGPRPVVGLGEVGDHSDRRSAYSRYHEPGYSMSILADAPFFGSGDS